MLPGTVDLSLDEWSFECFLIILIYCNVNKLAWDYYYIPINNRLSIHLSPKC